LLKDKEVVVVKDVVGEEVRALALLIVLLDLLSSTPDRLRSNSGAIHPSVPVVASMM